MASAWVPAQAGNLLKYFLGINASITLPAGFYLGLSVTTADPNAGTWTETTQSGYSRQQITWTYGGDVYAQNVAQLDFTNLGGGTILGQGIWSASTGGTLIFWSDLNTALQIPAQQTLSYKAGYIKVAL